MTLHDALQHLGRCDDTSCGMWFWLPTFAPMVLAFPVFSVLPVMMATVMSVIYAVMSMFAAVLCTLMTPHPIILM